MGLSVMTWNGVGRLVAIWLIAAAPVDAQSQTFAGKQIRLLVGFSPTAYGYDTYGRLLARYLGNYLPGHPLVVPENRPGAGSLRLAN